MSLRQALKRSREEQERSGALVERRLGGVVWFEAPKPIRPPQIYREGPVNGSADLYGAAPRGTAKPDLNVEWSADPLSDRENDLVGRRATRVWVKEGRRVQIRCKVAGVCDVDRCRFYLCEDADDDIQTVLDAKTCKDAVDAADEALQEAKEKRLKREKQLRKEERLRLEKDARAAADAADAAMEAEEKRWFFRCPCGVEGAQYDDGRDMVQCAACYDWAHDSCIVSRLRGFRGASKLGALRQCSYLCLRCAPKRYRSISCSCKTEERCANCTSTVTLRPPVKTKNAKTFHDALPELRIYTDPRRRDATIVQEVITGGCYERPAKDFEVLPGDRWLDIGAHIGAFSGVCLAAGADVVAVEPDADNFRLLEYNGSLRHVLDPCPGTFIPIKKAVLGSEEATSCTLYAHPQACAFRHSTERLALAQRRGLTETAWRGSTVEATSLTKLLEQYPDINGVKVDAQGAEVEIVASVRDWRNVRSQGGRAILPWGTLLDLGLPPAGAVAAVPCASLPRRVAARSRARRGMPGCDFLLVPYDASSCELASYKKERAPTVTHTRSVLKQSLKCHAAPGHEATICAPAASAHTAKEMCPPPALSSNAAAEIKLAPLPSRRRKDGLIRFAKDNTSQGGEDGILRAIFEQMGDGPRTVVDVGAWDGVHLSNTHSLLVPDASPWRGFLIEADSSKCEKLRKLHEPLGNVCVEAFVSCEDDARKLPAILGKHSCPWSVDLLSIDVDGVDYWLWRDFLESGRAAKVVIIEFNPSMPDDLHYVPPRSDAQRHGASLAALCALGEAYDYSLVETTLFNAVFADAATRALLVERGLVPADASRYDLHETTMGTQLYQLYDGTLKVHGTKKLLWHRRPIDERKIQVLGEAERLFPFAPGGTSTEKKPRRPKRRKRRRSPDTKPPPCAAPYAAYALAALFVASLVVHRRR